MSDYYSILGLAKTATEIEIKTAFRKLVKIYHPDKNPNDPNAKSLFENIVKAYNTLINPHQRKRYDNLNFGTVTQFPKSQQSNKKNQKDWSFTDEELKRRQYYKNYYNSKKHTINTQSNKPNYNDYKYILFATPIAVGLFMLIIAMFNTEPKTKKTETLVNEIKTNSIHLTNGNMPYSSFFGTVKTVDSKDIFKIKNSTIFDAIIIVFDKKTKSYLQHSYVKSSFSITFSMLPKTGVYWKCVIGKNWNPEKLIFNNTISGGFDSLVQYQNWKNNPTLFTNDNEEEITLLTIINPTSENKQYISNDIDFFEK